MSSSRDLKKQYGKDYKQSAEEETTAFNSSSLSDDDLHSSLHSNRSTSAFNTRATAGSSSELHNATNLSAEVAAARRAEDRQLKSIQIMDALNEMDLPPRYLQVLQEQAQQMKNMRIAVTVLGVILVVVTLVMVITFVGHNDSLAAQQALFNHKLLNKEQDPNAMTQYINEKAKVVSQTNVPGTVQFVNAAMDKNGNTVYIIDPLDPAEPSRLIHCHDAKCEKNTAMGLTLQIQADSHMQLRSDNDYPVISLAMDTSMGVILCLDLECNKFETATVNVTLNNGDDVQLANHQVHLTSKNVPVLTAQDMKSNTIIVAACTDDLCTKVLISQWPTQAGRTTNPDTMAAVMNKRNDTVIVAMGGSEGLKVLTCLTLSCHTAVWTDTGIEDSITSLAITMDTKNTAPVIALTYTIPAKIIKGKSSKSSRSLVLVRCANTRCTQNHVANLRIREIDVLGLSIMLDKTTNVPLILFDQNGPQLIACLNEKCVGDTLRESLPSNLLGYTSSFVNNDKTIAVIAPLKRQEKEVENEDDADDSDSNDGSESEHGESQQDVHAYVRIQNPLHSSQ